MTVATPTDLDLRTALEPLARRLADRISFADDDRASFATDFGRGRFRKPAAVARCRSSAEVAEALCTAQ